MIASDVIISTSVVKATLENIIFDLEIIFQKIQIDNEILGIKYHNNMKGDIKTTGSFFNQATLKIFVASEMKEVSLKVFKNGNFHICGVKNEIQANKAIEIFLFKIKNIRGIEEIEVIVYEGLIYKKKEYISSRVHDRFNHVTIYGKKDDNYVEIGNRKLDEFFIQGIKVEPVLKYFIEKKHTNFVKKMYNFNGKYIGECHFIMIRKTKSLIKYNLNYVKKTENIYDIFNKYGEIIGERHFIFKTEDDYVPPDNFKIIKLSYNAISDDYNRDILKMDKNIKILNINANFSLNLKNKFIDRNKLHNTLVDKYKLRSYYKPDTKYPAIILRVYFDKDLNQIYNQDDSFYKFSISIFQNGKILISGCEKEEHLSFIKNFIMKIFTDNDLFVNDTELDYVGLSSKLPSLNIWDIFDLI